MISPVWSGLVGATTFGSPRLRCLPQGRVWHCWQRRKGVEIPRWRLLDWLLLIALNATVFWASGNLGPLHQVKVERQTVSAQEGMVPQRLAEVPH